jgi:hypothetical protein
MAAAFLFFYLGRVGLGLLQKQRGSGYELLFSGLGASGAVCWEHASVSMPSPISGRLGHFRTLV